MLINWRCGWLGSASLLIRLVHQDRCEARRTVLCLVMRRRERRKGTRSVCGRDSSIGMMIICPASILVGSCTRKNTFGHDQVFDQRVVVNGPELVDSLLGEIGS